MAYADPERKLEYDRAYRAANPERDREYHRTYRAANRDRIRERAHTYREANPERLRANNRTTRHGITREQRDALYLAQGGLCAGCSEPFLDDDLEVDHDHECCPGERSCGRCIRGLLCHGCNCLDVLAGEPWLHASDPRQIQEVSSA